MIQTNFTIQKQVNSVDFKSLSVVKHLDGTVAFFVFTLTYDDGSIESTEVKLSGDKFNTFWENFDTTSKIYETFFAEMNQPFTPASNMDETLINPSVETIDG